MTAVVTDPAETADRIVGLGRRLAGPAAVRPLIRERPLAPLTTYKVGGCARFWTAADGVGDLLALARVLSSEAAESGCGPLPVLMLGRGSNLLVADRGFDGLAVMLGPRLRCFEIASGGPVAARGAGASAGAGDEATSGVGVLVSAGGGTPMPMLARACAAAGLRGFEWAVGVPGTVGGAVRMNAGSHDSDMAAVLVDATVVDLHSGRIALRSASSLRLDYRSSGLASHQVVVGVRLRLAPGDVGAARAALAKVTRWRRANQPGGRNAGSVFANPAGDSAGRLLHAVGVKGLRVGTASVSAKHANFIQSDRGGNARDIIAVMGEARRRVLAAYGVELRVETHLVGFEPEETAGLR